MPARSSCSARRLAPCLVRVNTSARLTVVASQQALEERALVGASHVMNRLLTVSAAVAAGDDRDCDRIDAGCASTSSANRLGAWWPKKNSV